MAVNTYVNNYTVKTCYHTCPFFTVNGNIMECGHPFFDDAESSYDRCIIDHDNSKTTYPEKCPLRNGTTVVIKTVKLNEEE